MKSDKRHILRDVLRFLEDITIPNNCVLEFKGGSLRGGTLTGNGCKLAETDRELIGFRISVRSSDSSKVSNI